MVFVQRCELFGIPIDLLTMQQTVALAHRAMQSRMRLHHVALNVAKLVKALDDEDLRRDVVNSDLVGIDGAGIVLGARLLGAPVPERVAGVDLMFEILGLCEREGFRPYFFGATDEVLQSALAEVKRRWPKLVIAGARNGYFKPEESRAIVESIRDSKADCLFVGISSPIKERFCHAYRDALEIPFVMGVGGSLDILAGKTRRAPRVLQQAGLEWAYRIAQEPGRMWQRYASTNGVYAWMLLKALLGRQRIATVPRTFFGGP